MVRRKRLVRRYYFPEAYDNGEGLINAAMPAVVLTVIVLLFLGWSVYLGSITEFIDRRRERCHTAHP